MKSVFVDCTPELDTVLKSRRFEVPSSLTIHHGVSSDAELMELCSPAELLLVEHTVIPASILSRCSKLRAIVFMGTGASFYIPLEEARALGIEVRTIPGYGNRAVAEHALALALAGARQVARMDRELRRGVWVPRGGVQLYERKIAVVGLGDIGRTFADMAAALGMRVAGWNRTRKNLPYFVDDLDSALRGADVVSLHLALTSETEGLIDASRLALLSRGALLVNTARARLVEHSALRDALKSGQLAHAAMDVFEEEPLGAQHEWALMDDVTLTAHAASTTEEAHAELWTRALAAVKSLESSGQNG